jgi:hypothetical protein
MIAHNCYVSQQGIRSFLFSKLTRAKIMNQSSHPSLFICFRRAQTLAIMTGVAMPTMIHVDWSTIGPRFSVGGGSCCPGTGGAIVSPLNGSEVSKYQAEDAAFVDSGECFSLKEERAREREIQRETGIGSSRFRMPEA